MELILLLNYLTLATQSADFCERFYSNSKEMKVSHLVFGSESNDIEKLTKLAMQIANIKIL